MVVSENHLTDTGGIQLLLGPPAIAMVNGSLNFSFAAPVTNKMYNWNVRISFAQQSTNRSIRDPLAILFAELQHSDNELQLLP